MSGEASELRSDILIVGASYTGLLAALSFARTLGPETRIIVTDKMSPDTIAADPRCFALSASSRRLLAALGVWELISSEAQDVTTIALTDTPLDAAVRPVLLDYDNRLETGEAGASIVPGAALLTGLMARVQGRTPNSGDYRRRSDGARTGSGAVDHDGRHGPPLHSPARYRRGRAWIAHPPTGWHPDDGLSPWPGRDRRDHPAFRAASWVRHTALPAVGGRLRSCRSRAVVPASPGVRRRTRPRVSWRSTLPVSLERSPGAPVGRLGEITLEGSPASFPLSSHVAREFIGPRLVLVGDAAHGVHPIAGQGLNLAMRDVAVLAQCVGEAVKVGLDFGDGTALERYQRWRRFDSTVSTGGVRRAKPAVLERRVLAALSARGRARVGQSDARAQADVRPRGGGAYG